MSDLIRDIFETAGNRIRSPIVGSIAISFIAVNWQPVFYMLFANRPVRQRFLFFDENTSNLSLFLLPLSFGIILAVAAPWAKLIGAMIAASPNRRLIALQARAKIEREIEWLSLEAEKEQANAKLEDAKENRLIQASRRKSEALDVGGEELADELEENRHSVESSEKDFNGRPIHEGWEEEVLLALSANATHILLQLSSSTSGAVEEKNKSFGDEQFAGFWFEGKPFALLTEPRKYVEVKEALAELESFDLVRDVDSITAITPRGTRVAEVQVQMVE